MNTEISNQDEVRPVDSLANDIAAARTFSELADVRLRLQHTIGILDDERRVLETAVIGREKSLITFYLAEPRLGL
ncbi:MAG: hypothetical protein KGL39_36875 [Patescibacteria group bacterium]|nr:hypothetical protein [Patescibacteria group bacterium]